ncbi:MAPEG family protein [Variovorax sp.]|uniref:MAPEG family protein n=1 Tax=Variovorax sp. TaxID=1871043 RepID=UPI003BAD7BDD
MNNPSILYPVFALAGWTSLVLLLIPFRRIRAAMRREVGPHDFRLGESAAVPDAVRLPNRNYMNLLEIPVLFYVVCLLSYMAAAPSTAAVALAWAYVALRVLHSVVHLTYNHVIHRLVLFAASNGVLVMLWVSAAVRLVR